MLYVSTRNKTDAFTAYRALHEDSAPDGGMYVPFQLPCYTAEELRILREKTFGENVAHILNLFFSARLSGWDIDFCVGRCPVKLVSMSHRIVIAEVWHNPESTYTHMVESLYLKLCGEKCTRRQPTRWARTAIEIAVIFGLFSEMARAGITTADIAAASADFISPMASWYARRMGLPVGTVICACNENGAVWDLLHRGEFNTNAPVIRTEMPELDVSRPAGIECLIYGALGTDGVRRYLDACQKCTTFQLHEVDFAQLSAGMSAAVIGRERIDAIINSVYRTNSYIIDSYTALCYGGLQDHRARTGESRTTLMLAERSPLFSSDAICKVIGITKNELSARVNVPKE